MINKAYIRFRENLPDNPNTFAAAEGFSQRGAEIVPFYGFGDLETFKDVGPETIVCGNIGDVWAALKALNVEIPPPVDYPEHLNWMFGREISRATLGEIRNSTKIRFVKPTTQKLFTGFVWDPHDPRCRLNVAVYPDETQCWTSNVVEFVSEWRCFVRNKEVIGVKHYKGDWSKSPKKLILEKAVSDSNTCGLMPDAYSVDAGVTANGQTLLVEVNEGYALGHYGLASILYAGFLETRWKQLTLGVSVLQEPRQE